MVYVLVLDSLAVAVAFGEIEAAWPGVARTTLAWITTGFTIAIASTMLVVGQIADRIGWRKVFVMGMVMFVVGGLIAISASTIWVLIAARVLQGMAAAMFTVTGFPLALPSFPPAKRGQAMGWIGVGGAGAALLGPVVGGGVISLFGWRAGLMLPLPLCLIAALAAPRFLDERRGGKRSIDITGVVLGTVGVGALTLAILQREVLVAPVSMVALGLFARRVSRHHNPVIRPGLFADRRYLWATISQLATQMAIFAWFFSMPLFLTNVWEWSTLATGVALAIPMLISFNAVSAGNYADRHGYRPVLFYGGLIAAVGLGWWALTLTDTPSVLFIGVGLVVFGMGSGMVGVTGMAAALNSVSDDDLAEANAALQTTRRLIQGIGAAVALAILGNRDATSVQHFKIVWLVAAGGYALSSVVLWFYPRERRFASLRG